MSEVRRHTKPHNTRTFAERSVFLHVIKSDEEFAHVLDGCTGCGVRVCVCVCEREELSVCVRVCLCMCRIHTKFSEF